MGIYNFNTGQEYISIDKLPDFRSDDEKLFSPLAIYNHDNPDIAYAERLSEEIINISGAWVTVMKRTKDNGTVNNVWDENSNPKYLNGVKMKAHFAPQPANIELTKWGIDVPNKTTLTFSRAVVYKQFGKEMIMPGDIIEAPHNTLSALQTSTPYESANKMDRYRVINAADAGNFRYRWLYWNCQCDNLSHGLDAEHR